MFRRICAPPEFNIRIYDPITSHLTNVPADLQSAGNEYQDLFNPITSYLASPHTFNANIALNFSLLTS